MQPPGPGKPPPGVVFDCAMSGVGDALALAILYALEGKNEARVLSVSVSRPSLKAAIFCDLLARFYGGFGRFPVGLAAGTGVADEGGWLVAIVDRKDAAGEMLYPRGIQKFTDTGLVPAVARNVLTAQLDGNAIVILTGPATNLAKMLELSGVKELIAAKVRALHLVEEGLHGDAAAAKKLFAGWPTPIVMVGPDVGAAIPYPASSFEKDFAWAPNHPLVDGYRAAGAGDVPASAAAAALHAVRPDAGLFKLSDAGAIQVGDDGRARFTVSAGGKHRVLSADLAQREAVVQAYTNLASARPNRQPRPRRGQ